MEDTNINVYDDEGTSDATSDNSRTPLRTHRTQMPPQYVGRK